MVALFALFALLLVARLPFLPTADLLNRHLMLTTAPPPLHSVLTNLMLVPVGGMAIVLVRLTLGIRILGPFRAILLAFAFLITGIVTGLLVLAATLGVIIALRPLLRALQLPYFGRVAVLLSAVALVMLAGVLSGVWLDLVALRQVAYFPVVVLCLLADAFAIAWAKEGRTSALWRGATTAAVAVVLTLVAGLPGFRELLLRYPELLLAELACILLIARYGDWRLFEWLNPKTGPDEEDDKEADFVAIRPRSVSRSAKRNRRIIKIPSRSAHRDPGMKVAVVWNHSREGVINGFGRPSPEKYSRRHVQMVVDALAEVGHEPICFEGDKHLLARLEEFMPNPNRSTPTGLVFNMAYGIQGDCRYTHVPALLEMAGVPYTGSTPMGHALALDKVITKVLMESAGVPTPAYRVLTQMPEGELGLRFPLVVKPRHESTSYGLQFIRTPEDLPAAIEAIVGQYRQAALVEEYIDGREVAIGLLGNEQLEFLPPIELDFGDRETRLMTWADKYHKRADEPKKICPAVLDAELATRLQQLAAATFHACHCRDYARVDIRIDPNGQPFVLEINSMASLGPNGSFVQAAVQAGYTFTTLVARIVDITHERYFGTPAPRSTGEVPDPPSRQAG